MPSRAAESTGAVDARARCCDCPFGCDMGVGSVLSVASEPTSNAAGVRSDSRLVSLPALTAGLAHRGRLLSDAGSCVAIGSAPSQLLLLTACACGLSATLRCCGSAEARMSPFACGPASGCPLSSCPVMPLHSCAVCTTLIGCMAAPGPLTPSACSLVCGSSGKAEVKRCCPDLCPACHCRSSGRKGIAADHVGCLPPNREGDETGCLATLIWL